VLFVSHNMAAVQKLCDRAVWLRGGQVEMVGDSASVVSTYLEASSRVGSDAALPPGYLYHRHACDDGKKARVTSLQLLDREGRPVEEAATMEPARFRIGFEVDANFRSFSAELHVYSPDGVPLLFTSTAPDHDRPFSVSPGRYTVDCDIEQFPFSAGEYVIGLALAMPGVEYVWRNDAACNLHVSPRDVYRSGMPPTVKRCLVATRHEWSSPQSLAPQEAMPHA
jgi:lipopolysaccharide transport system ATP-binding protein